MRCPAFIYLDLGRVVVDFDHALAWQKVAAITGLAEADIEQFFTADDRPRRIETGLLAWDTLHAEFVRAMAVEVDVDALARAAGDIFTLRVEMLPVIAAIERAGVPLGILSNTCDIHWQHLLRCRYGILPGGISPLVLSYEVGAMKPHPSIYEAAVAKAGGAGRPHLLLRRYSCARRGSPGCWLGRGSVHRCSAACRAAGQPRCADGPVGPDGHHVARPAKTVRPSHTASSPPMLLAATKPTAAVVWPACTRRTVS